MSEESKNVTRREFIKGVGGIGVIAIFGGMVLRGFMQPDEIFAFAIPASKGYLLVDTEYMTPLQHPNSKLSKVKVSLKRLSNYKGWVGCHRATGTRLAGLTFVDFTGVIGTTVGSRAAQGVRCRGL